MKVFEIHITGDRGILKEFEDIGIKTISIDLLQPNGEHFQTEHMSSFTSRHECYEDCKKMVDSIVANLKSEIYRVKIESPVYTDYLDRAVYIEAHFPVNPDIAYPMSQNTSSKKILATSRCYERNEFKQFAAAYGSFDVELCLYDDYIREDFEWFKLYDNK